ncbi:MAG: phosphate/phosphite/phosphonate ABC transporter substrate-binding protein [Bacteroidota bacterium]
MKTPFLISLLLISLLPACNRTGPPEQIEELVIGFVPSEEAERMVKNMEPVTGFLESELAIPVKIFQGSDYTAIIEGMRGEKVDIGVFGPFSYVLASNKAGAEPLVVPCSKSGVPAHYQSLIITHVGTGLTTMNELMDTSGAYSLSFSDPASTSGHLVPRGHLRRLDIVPEDHFTDILFSGSHTATILSLANQKVDVAGCSYNVFKKMIEREMLDTSQVRILWKSAPMPVDLVTVRKGLPEKVKQQLREIYVRVADEEPASAGYFYEEWNDSTLVFQPAHDSLYSEIRRLSQLVMNDL